MAIENANDHPLKVSIVQGEEIFANSHPYKVTIEGGGGGGGGEARVVDTLPEQGESGYIYLVLKEHTQEGDVYDEWIWALQQDGTTYGWEHLGLTNEVKTGAPTILGRGDFNWNSQTKDKTTPYDCFALWLLDDGLYAFESDVKLTDLRANNSSGTWHIGADITSRKKASTVLIMSGDASGGNTYKIMLCPTSIDQHTGRQNMVWAYATYLNGNQIRHGGGGVVLHSADVVDDLNGGGLPSMGAVLPLSAYQGKVLDEKIDNNIGKAKVLTTADYNWNNTTHDATEPYDSVALWLLDPGLYIFDANVVGYIGYDINSTQTWISSDTKHLYQITPAGTHGKMIIGWEIFIWSGGSPFPMAVTYRLVNENINGWGKIAAPIDNLTSSLTDVALSANQGRVLDGKIGDISTVLQTLTTGSGV